RAADRAEAEPEACALVASADILGGAAGHPVGRGEGGERGKDAAGAALAGEAVAEADSARLTLHLDSQLTAGAGGCSGRHRAPRGTCSTDYSTDRRFAAKKGRNVHCLSQRIQI